MAKFIIEKAVITGIERVAFRNGENALKLTLSEIVSSSGRTFNNSIKVEFAGNYTKEIPTSFDIIGLDCSVSGFISTLEKNDNIYVFLKGKSLVIHGLERKTTTKPQENIDHDVELDDFRGSDEDDDLPF